MKIILLALLALTSVASCLTGLYMLAGLPWVLLTAGAAGAGLTIFYDFDSKGKGGK